MNYEERTLVPLGEKLQNLWELGGQVSENAVGNIENYAVG